MPENIKTAEFLQKLAPCIERGDLDACVEEAARVAQEMGVGAGELLDLSTFMIDNGKYDFGYVIALAAVQVLEENKADAFYNAAFAAGKLELRQKEEEHYKKTIELDSKNASARFNYAILLENQGRKPEAIEQCKKAIDINPENLKAYIFYANLLYKSDKKKDAEKFFKKAIESDPKNFKLHAAYISVLIDWDRRKDALKEIEIVSNILKESRQVAISHIIKANFYQKYSEKNLIKKRFIESSEDADKAGEEYLKAAETVEGEIKYALELKGNVCKAQSLIRKEHKTNQELVDDLKNASEFYKKASVCPAGGTEETCGACYSVMEVFSQALTALEEVVHNNKPSISKEDWNVKLEKSKEVYIKKGSEKGSALISALKELIKCVDELAYYTARKSSLQKKRLEECYKTLEDVSSKVEGGLRNITDPANDILKNYAKEMGVQMPEEKALNETPSRRSFIKLLRYIVIILGVIGSIIAILQFLKLDSSTLEFIKYLSSRIGIP